MNSAEGAGPKARWLIALTVMLPTILDVLDRTIVNVALPDMMGALGASADQITWVLTSYIVASAIVMPLTGYLVERVGQRTLLLVSVGGFVACSGLCGMSTSLDAMVILRTFQGLFGASLIPLSQSLMIDTYPKEERGKAMAIYGLGIMVAPVLGPTIGGYLTETASWRWVFYINVPVGALAFVMAARVIPARPGRDVRTDWTGLALVTLGIGGMQFALDRGNDEDWFASNLILASATISAVAIAIFIVRGWRKRDNIVNLRLFKDRNFASATVLIGVVGMGLYGTMVALPLLLERLLGYPPMETGLVMAPRGIASAVAMMVVGRLVPRIDPRKIIALGILLSTAATAFMAGYNLEISAAYIIWPGVIQGIGLGFIFVPLTVVAYESLPPEASASAAGVFSLIRTLGGSIGISVVSTVIVRGTQANWNRLGGHVSPFNPDLPAWLGAQGLSLQDPEAIARLAGELARQAEMLAYVGAFHMISLFFLCMLPLAFLAQRPPPTARVAGPGH
ncbi:MAG: DHA2 family efflux MFS transporter permease subunit [Myxococcales bacterium]|nr:DHA2 family efflux MFS transporter permease subunit [Myxococcales bacterium]